jgi:hypothetical protein
VTRCYEHMIPIVLIRDSKTTSIWHWRRAASNFEVVCVCAIAAPGNHCSLFWILMMHSVSMMEKSVAIVHAFRPKVLIATTGIVYA